MPGCCDAVAVGKQSQGSGIAPGMPCAAFNTSNLCYGNYQEDCSWKPACCKWDGTDLYWDCSSCTDATKDDPTHGTCAENHCSNSTKAVRRTVPLGFGLRNREPLPII